MKTIKLIFPAQFSKEIIDLPGSKSISNRVLIVRAISNQEFHIGNLSKSDDTKILAEMLRQSSDHYDAGHAGTTFRFMTAFLAIKEGTQILTGSNRMKQRPIGPLVNALRSLGAEIEYLEKENFPPLLLKPFDREQSVRDLEISGNMSSQFISALLMIAPVLEKGLKLTISGGLVSRPYVEMTLKVMKTFGIYYNWSKNAIHVLPQKYQCLDYVVESDWSSASYFYAIASQRKDSRIGLKGLFEESVQGDSEIMPIASKFGIESKFDEKGILWIKNERNSNPAKLEFDFLNIPDLAQTIVVLCASKGIECLCTGLKTLKIKETNRIAALKNELQKFGVQFDKVTSGSEQAGDREFYLLSGRAKAGLIITVETYLDHRMAMAFVALASIAPVAIADPDVVSKSFPSFWDELRKLGIRTELKS